MTLEQQQPDEVEVQPQPSLRVIVAANEQAIA